MNLPCKYLITCVLCQMLNMTATKNKTKLHIFEGFERDVLLIKVASFLFIIGFFSYLCRILFRRLSD